MRFQTVSILQFVGECSHKLVFKGLAHRTDIKELLWRRPTVASPHITNTSQWLQPTANTLVRSVPAWKEIPLCGYTTPLSWLSSIFFDTALVNMIASNREFVWYEVANVTGDEAEGVKWGDTALNGRNYSDRLNRLFLFNLSLQRAEVTPFLVCPIWPDFRTKVVWQ